MWYAYFCVVTTFENQRPWTQMLSYPHVCVWLLCFLKIVESDDFIFLHLCVSQLGKLRKVGSYARISFHVCVGHAWNLGIVDADDVISCPMCLACLKTKDGGCRWCDSLTFICAYLSPDPINLAPASSPSISHTHPHDAPADNVKAELHFQKLHFAFTGCGYFDYLIGLHLCVWIVRKVGMVGSDHATCLQLFASHVRKPRILDSCDSISFYLFSLYLFVGGSGWVYSRPLYSFQETLVLLLHTTPYIYSLLLPGSARLDPKWPFRCGRPESDENLHSLFCGFTFLTFHIAGVLQWIIVVGAFSFGSQCNADHFRQ